MSMFRILTVLLLSLCCSAQTFRVLHQFYTLDGYTPFSGVVRDKAGNLYGTTWTGGKYKKGNVFKIAPDGTLTSLHDFRRGEGAYPYATPLLDTFGNLFGTNTQAPNDGGTLWEVRSDGGFAVLMTFYGVFGDQPYGGVISDPVGNLYGTTAGGEYVGAVYKFNVASRQETVLYNFKGVPDGSDPASPLHRDAQGNFYGTTFSGGTYDVGTIFKVDPTGNTTILYNFTNGTDGRWTTAGVIEDGHGNLYGTMPYGGIGGGIIYKFELATSTFTILHTFTGIDGSAPQAGLVADKAGNLYGTTLYGGDFGFGNVFRLDVNNNISNLYSFTWHADGAFPFAPLTLDVEGNLYGTTSQGGYATCDCGVVFEITP